MLWRDMLIRNVIKTLAIAAIAVSLIATPLNAKGGGGGGGGGGGHSSASSGSHASSSVSSRLSSTSSGYSKGSGSVSAGGSKTSASGDALSSASTRNMSTTSFSAYQAERAASVRPASPVDKSTLNNSVFNNTRSSYGSDVNTYMNKRTEYYTSYRARSPEVFVINSNLRPNYGVYDSGFLTGMMIGQLGSNHAANMSWMAAQYNQPWYNSYRNDLNEQAATNEKLRARLVELDAEIEMLKARGGEPADVTVLPPDIQPEIAIAPEAVIAATSDEESTRFRFSPIMLLSVFGVAIAALVIILFRL